MPFCPKCHYEYVSGIVTCPDCNVPLVDKLAEERKSDPAEEEYVELHPLPGHIYAEMVKEALERADIPCILIPDMISTGLQVKGTAVPGNQMRLRVLKKDAARAEEILHTMMDHI
ncbi:hypothetical protein EH222_10860 [candidate division KSB1 bacterium]|nr:MAG: hypothetical protein EH222_10860 [candidate division KSB1 bacterium]